MNSFKSRASQRCDKSTYRTQQGSFFDRVDALCHPCLMRPNFLVVVCTSASLGGCLLGVLAYTVIESVLVGVKHAAFKVNGPAVYTVSEASETWWVSPPRSSHSPMQGSAPPRPDLTSDEVSNGVDPTSPKPTTPDEAVCDQRFGYGLVRAWRSTGAEFCSPIDGNGTTVTCYEHKQEVRSF